MASKRLLLTVSAVLSLLAAAPASATDSGGAAALPLAQEPGGGVLAPPPDGAAPAAEAAQETTPTTPGGEEQPPDEEPTETETAPDEEIVGPVDELPQDGAGVDTGAGGFLPSTGLEVAALSMIGLGLLMAGLALRPTSSWPPPRDRRSRSLPRR